MVRPVRLTQSEVERALRAAYAVLREPGGLMPHAVVEDLVGLDAYRRFLRCPDTEALAAYAEDRLPFEEALGVAAHENRCPVCQADIADLRGIAGRWATQLMAALPAWATPFVGREALRESLAATLEDAPLVTLAAPAGTGKTRLTLETAIEQSWRFPDGVWYVPAGVGGVTLAAEIARAVALPLEPRAAPVEQLRAFFADKRALLVLDDVPVGSPAARMVAELVGATPDLRCLAATRSSEGGFGIAGEHMVPLPPLETHVAGGKGDSESLRLFSEHVRVASPGYVLDEPDLASAAGICARAAGMPLGIELAAARVGEMSPRNILETLEQRGGRPVARQDPSESLRDLLAWSCDLLPERERNLLQQLSVFEGGFFAEQAAVVCDADDAPEVLRSLHGKALLECSEILERDRYRLPTAVRGFVRRRLGARAASVERKHSVYFLDYARQRSAALDGAGQAEALAELSADLPNLRAGMDRAAQAADEAGSDAGRYGLALHRFLMLHGYWQECEARLRVGADAFARAEELEGREQAELALARCLTSRGGYDEAESLLRALAANAGRRGEEGMPHLAAARYALGHLAYYRGRNDEAIRLYDQALRHFEVIGDERSAADCWYSLGHLALTQGQTERAERLLAQSLSTYRRSGDRSRLADTLVNLGILAFDQGRWEEARRRYEECMEIRQALGDVRGIASVINDLGILWQERGEHGRAAYCFAEAERRFERLGDRRARGAVLCSQGDLALDQNDALRARDRFESALKIFQALGDARSTARALGELGRVARQEGRDGEALRLHRESLTRLRDLGDAAGAATALRYCAELAAGYGDRERAALLLNVALRSCAERGSSECAAIEAALRPLEEGIGGEPADALRRRASALSLDEAVALALRD